MAEKSRTYGERVRETRIALGLSVGRLAALARLSESTVRRIESGAITNPGAFTGLALADALGADPYYLAFGDAGWTPE